MYIMYIANTVSAYYMLLALKHYHYSNIITLHYDIIITLLLYSKFFVIETFNLYNI